MRVKPAAATSGVEAAEPRGIVSITGGDWTVEHPVPICTLESGTEWPSFTRSLEAANKILEREHEKAFDFWRRGDRLRNFFWQFSTGRGGPTRVLPPRHHGIRRSELQL
jgi:hypothetical protein